MAQIILLIPLILWLAWQSDPVISQLDWLWGSGILMFGMLTIVLMMRLWANRVMDIATIHLSRPVDRFHRAMFSARIFVIAWHAVGLFTLGWGEAVEAIIPTGHLPLVLPQILFSMLPVLITWVGLSWAQYPLDRAVREQNVLDQLNMGEIVRPVPSLGAHLIQFIRQQILFALTPILFVMLLRDGARMVLWWRNYPYNDWVEGIISVVTIGMVFVLSPTILRRVLPTQSMPKDWPIRQRLEALCARLNMKYQDILLWKTHYSIANAAVMGLCKPVRYVMMSDQLMDRMSDEQIEAVFAHEAGHVIHKHIFWYVVFLITFIIGLAAIGDLSANIFQQISMPDWFPMELVVELGGFLVLILAFGVLSRSFERQADLFAARSLSKEHLPDDPHDRHVETEGVATFSSALYAVARINHMAIDAPTTRNKFAPSFWLAWFVFQVNNFLHGSIGSRVRYLQSLPSNPASTIKFDKKMRLIRIALTLSSITAVTYTCTVFWLHHR